MTYIAWNPADVKHCFHTSKWSLWISYSKVTDFHCTKSSNQISGDKISNDAQRHQMRNGSVGFSMSMDGVGSL